jgi:hypothetical protein
MIEKELDTRFQEAVTIASLMTQASYPKMSSYYMPATNRLLFALEPRQTLTYHLRDAFKTNAWMQISHLTADEAEQYIEIINSLLKK